MAEEKQITFTYQEIVETLLKKHGIHEGLWGLYLRFGLSAANVAVEPKGTFLPAAIIPVQEIGIQRFDEPSNLTVDAASVNPRPSVKMRSVKQGKKK